MAENDGAAALGFRDLEFKTPADRFTFFAREALRGGSPLYHALALGVSQAPGLMALAAMAAPGQPPPNMLFSAVHFLLLAGAEHALTAYFPSCGGQRMPDAGLMTHFSDFCARHKEALSALIGRRVTNTNEVLRAAVLAPGFAHVAAREGTPLALLELGPSAGLNLNFDRYQYAFPAAIGEGGENAVFWGPSPVHIVSEARPQAPLMPPRPPEIAWRLGLELNPVDLEDAADRLWLAALVWPERVDRLERLRAAIALARQYPPPIQAGDAVSHLGAAIAAAPRDATLVIYHSAFLYQLEEKARASLHQTIGAAARERAIWRLSFDGVGAEGDFPLVASRYAGTQCDIRRLADSTPHGLWINWL